MTVDHAIIENVTRQEFEQLRTDLQTVRASLTNLFNVPKEEKDYIPFQALQGMLADLQRRQESLEQVIVTTPTKALEIPLLKRDIENLKLAQQANATAVKESVDRIYDLNKWLLGAMAISVVMLAVANSIKGRAPEKAT